MKVSFKEVFESDSWLITKVMQGYGVHMISAKRRFPVADKSSFFCKWGSNAYLERLARSNYGKKLRDFSNYQY